MEEAATLHLMLAWLQHEAAARVLEEQTVARAACALRWHSRPCGHCQDAQAPATQSLLACSRVTG